MSNFFEQLRKRRVIRVAGMYAVAGWLLIEVGMALETTLNLPDWFDTVVTALVLIGFPIALILAWAFDITPDGIQRTTSDSAAESAPAGRAVDVTIIAALIALAGIVAWQATRTTTGGSADSAVADASPSPAVEDQSIAVLPFVALSSNQDDTFFGKGISEELLNSLAQFPTLKVAARTSAFSFVGKDVDLRVVGEQLGVAHVLEGSVRRSGDRLRITAQLIRAADGFHLWSETFDRKLTDVFEIQDEIVAKLSQVLQFRLGVGAGTGRAANTTANPRAYESYLRGLDLWWQRDANRNNRSDAITAFLRTTELAPEFADGWATYGVSMALSSPGSSTHLTEKEVAPASRLALYRALELDPQNIRAMAGLVYFHTAIDMDIPKASAYLERVTALAPNDPFAQYMAARFASVVGDHSTMRRATQRMLDSDPLNQTKQRVAFSYSAFDGNFDTASPHYARSIRNVERCIAAQSCSDFVATTTVGLLLVSAVQAGSDEQVAEVFELTMQAIDQTGDAETKASLRCLAAVYGSLRGLSDRSCLIEAFNTSDIADWTDPVSVSLLAREHNLAEVTDILFDTSMLRFGFQASNSFLALIDGPFAAPEQLRRHPRYHEWWAIPGNAGLAEARRANGQSAGLPLPVQP